MRHGSILIYERHKKGFSLESLVEHFTRYGISLTCPDSGFITRFEKSGDQVKTTQDDLMNVLSVERTVAFQWWFRDSLDLGCRIRRLPQDVVAHSYWLDGVTGDELTLAVKATTDFFRRSVELSTGLAFVVDYHAELRPFDWDSVVLQQDTPLPEPIEWPEVIGLAAQHPLARELLQRSKQPDLKGCVFCSRGQ